jgi:alpha-1,6-mannosyltransferase
VVVGANTSRPVAAGQEQAALLALSALGVLLLAYVAIGPWLIRSFGFGVFIPSLAASGTVAIGATALAPSVPTRRALIVILGLALAMRLLLVFQEPFLSTDIYRYVWDGRVQAAGINPYAYVPADPALAALRDAAIYPNINRADYAATAYPPVAQMLLLAVTRISESLVALRLAMVASEAVVVLVMIDLLRRLELPPAAVVAWAWHPLATWEIANSGHLDAPMVALLMVGIWLLVRSRPTLGAVAIALATLVKPYAAVVLPVFWRPWDWRVPLAVAVTIAACYAPYLGVGRRVFGFVTAGYLSEEGFSGGDGIWLVTLVRALLGNVPGLTAVYMVVGLGVLGWLALRSIQRPRTSVRETLTEVAVLLMAGLFFISPNYAWYFLAIVPFTVLGGGIPVWAMTLGAILLYRPLILPANDLAWKTLATLPFVATLAFVLVQRRRGSISKLWASP